MGRVVIRLRALGSLVPVALLHMMLLSVGNLYLISPVGAYEVVFSEDVTTDFARGNIDVPGLIRQDWLMLPLIGFCGLASKFATAHKFDSPAVRGTFFTTFEYLTHDCTAESKRDNNTCALLSASFAVCLGFPLDRRTCNHPWGYCSNFNFRLSYLWVANHTNITVATPRPLSQTSQSPHQLGSGSRLISTHHIELRTGSIDSTDHQHEQLGSGVREAAMGGRLDTGCDWRFSNLVPVAWDGIQNVLAVGQSLQSPDSTYSFVMQQDCNLVLYKGGADGKFEFNAKWATYSHYNDPFFHNCSAVLQPNGNLTVLDPSGNARWASNCTSSSWYTSALAVLRNGSVAVYEMNSGTVLWSSG